MCITFVYILINKKIKMGRQPNYIIIFIEILKFAIYLYM